MPDAASGEEAHPGAEADRALLVEAAEAAGEIAAARFGTRVAIEEKADGQGPVTEIDLAVDRALKERLTAARPDYGWLSEETADGPERLSADRVFIVDPIDGTRAFIEGQTGWAVAVAVVEAGSVTAAAVHLPARSETYAAALGGGATLGGAPLLPEPAPHDLGNAEVLAARPSFAPKHWPGGVPAIRRSFRSSLAWRLCLVAAGRFDGMLTIRPSWEWDVAAGSLIASEAGRRVSDAMGARLVFNARSPKTPGIMAADPRLHAHLVERRSEPGQGSSAAP
ncbi:MAG: inositol monophosphatase family protein [Pseudomonadota bacterium]